MLDITLGRATTHGHLTVFPLVAAGAPELPYTLMGDALAAATLRIGEVGQGSVPTLLAHNAGDADVLILDGEQLIGSKQNRMANRSILLPARSTVEIPVSCMEHGRWHFASASMRPSPQHSPAKVRRQVREQEVFMSARGAGVFPEALASAQGAVWDAIADTARKLGGASTSGAMDSIFDAHADRLGEMERAFAPVEDQVGLLAFVGSTPVGTDVVGGRALYARLHSRLLRGYLLDALDSAADRATSAGEAGPPPPNEVAAQRYLDTVRSARRVPSPTPGKGAYAVLTGPVVGGELRDGDLVAHLSAFPAEWTGRDPHEVGDREPPIPGPRHRRRGPPPMI